MAACYSDISILQCSSNPVDKWYHHHRTHCLQSCSLVSPSWLIYVFTGIQVKDSHIFIVSVLWAGNRYRLNETVFHHPCMFFPIAHELILKCVHGKIRTIVLRLKSLFDDSLQRFMSFTILYSQKKFGTSQLEKSSSLWSICRRDTSQNRYASVKFLSWVQMSCTTLPLWKPGISSWCALSLSCWHIFHKISLVTYHRYQSLLQQFLMMYRQMSDTDLRNNSVVLLYAGWKDSGGICSIIKIPNASASICRHKLPTDQMFQEFQGITAPIICIVLNFVVLKHQQLFVLQVISQLHFLSLLWRDVYLSLEPMAIIEYPYYLTCTSLIILSLELWFIIPNWGELAHEALFWWFVLWSSKTVYCL